MKKFFEILAAAVACLALSSAPAQERTGELSGRVVDPSGLGIQGAAVAAVNSATRASLSTVTGDHGFYHFRSLDVGVYDVTITHPGFKANVQTGVRLDRSSTPRSESRAAGSAS